MNTSPPDFNGFPKMARPSTSPAPRRAQARIPVYSASRSRPERCSRASANPSCRAEAASSHPPLAMCALARARQAITDWNVLGSSPRPPWPRARCATPARWDRIIVAGESGGGNLTLALGLRLKREGRLDPIRGPTAGYCDSVLGSGSRNSRSLERRPSSWRASYALTAT